MLSMQSAHRSITAGLACLALVSILLWAPDALAQQRDQSAKQDRPARPRAQKTPEQRKALILKRIWWNQEKKVSLLKLTPEARAKMDTLLVQHLDASAIFEGRNLASFADELEKGDWQAAQKEAQIAAELSSQAALSQTQLMIGVAKLLTTGQRKTLKEKFPNLLRRPWVLNRGPGGRPGGRR